MQQNPHQGQVVLITGAAAGIGEALARRIVELGGRVVLGDRNEPALDALVQELREAGGDEAAVGVVGDVTTTEANQRLVAAGLEAFGQIDVAAAGAGGYPAAKTIDEVSDEDWEQLLALNLTAAFKTARAVVPSMKERGSGRLIFFSSTAGRMQTPVGKGIVAYTAAKSGILGLMRHLAVELGPHGINVNAVAPGTTMTPRVQGVRTPEEVERMGAQIPLRRVATVEDQIGPLLFLCSPASGYMTGATLDVNGGRIML